MITNQRGDPIEETQLFSGVGYTWDDISDQERNDAIALICEHLKIEIWRTNATKHGDTEVLLRQGKLP